MKKTSRLYPTRQSQPTSLYAVVEALDKAGYRAPRLSPEPPRDRARPKGVLTIAFGNCPVETRAGARGKAEDGRNVSAETWVSVIRWREGYSVDLKHTLGGRFD